MVARLLSLARWAGKAKRAHHCPDCDVIDPSD
jgi:hypothetical protein